MSNILNRWPLTTFRAIHGKCRVVTFTKGDEQTTLLSFGEGPYTNVRFSAALGVLTPVEIAARKNELQVIERVNLKDPTKTVFTLCKVSDIITEDVDL